jgi:hypothetical protein
MTPPHNFFLKKNFLLEKEKYNASHIGIHAVSIKNAKLILFHYYVKLLTNNYSINKYFVIYNICVILDSNLKELI